MEKNEINHSFIIRSMGVFCLPWQTKTKRQTGQTFLSVFLIALTHFKHFAPTKSPYYFSGFWRGLVIEKKSSSFFLNSILPWKTKQKFSLMKGTSWVDHHQMSINCQVWFSHHFNGYEEKCNFHHFFPLY